MKIISLRINETAHYKFTLSDPEKMCDGMLRHLKKKKTHSRRACYILLSPRAIAVYLFFAKYTITLINVRTLHK